MRKFLSIIMSILLVATCTACGRYEKLEPAKALHSSPELNVNDEFYTAALTKGPVVLTDWVLNNRQFQITRDLLADSSVGFSAYDTMSFGNPKTFDIDIPFDTFIKGYNYDNFNVDEGKPSESMEDRYNWELKNQFMFANDAIYYLDNVEDFNSLTLNGLAVTYAFYDNEKISLLDIVKEQKIGNPYTENPAHFDVTDSKRLEYAQWVNEQAYRQACDNLEVEHAKLKDTVVKYLDQKYNGVDNGVQFSDYMTKNGVDFKAVESFIKAQKFGTLEIKDVNAYTSFMTFHPFVDIEYTVVIDGTEHYLHEIYFLEIDENNNNFEYKIAYVADFNGKFDYTLFRSGEFNVGEAFDWDPLKDECVDSYSTEGIGEFYFLDKREK